MWRVQTRLKRVPGSDRQPLNRPENGQQASKTGTFAAIRPKNDLFNKDSNGGS
jgi:hypothetical protein